MKICCHHTIFFSWMLLLFSCTSCNPQKKINKHISLSRKDKIPYGTWYAFENLPALFPEASIISNLASPETFYYDTVTPDDLRVHLKAYIIIGPRVIPDKQELSSIIRFAAAGHQVFISSLHIGDNLMKILKLKVSDSLSRGDNDSLRLSVDEPRHDGPVSYIYPGYCLDAYFESFDTTHTRVLGRNYLGKPDFIRIAFRHGGAIFIHLAPMAFSNFFLLHRQNKSYYDYVFSYLPRKTDEVIWDDYFRYKEAPQFSALHFILSNRSLRWAFWLAISLFLLLYVLESKRKQRALVTRMAPGNASVDFVRTIGRLYLQQKNNQNLAIKMITAFLEHVRLNFHIQTSMLNDDFSARLALRTGTEQGTVGKLVASIHYARIQPVLTDQELMDLHRQIEIFNKPL